MCVTIHITIFQRGRGESRIIHGARGLEAWTASGSFLFVSSSTGSLEGTRRCKEARITTAAAANDDVVAAAADDAASQDDGSGRKGMRHLPTAQKCP